MSITSLLAELSALDIRLRVENGTLCFDAPEGVFSDDIRQKVLESKPELIAFLQEECAEGEEPLTDKEQRLAALWREYLRSDVRSRNDDFFILGGHSLLLMRLVHQVEASGLGTIDLAAAISARTLGKMAALIDGADDTAPASPSPAERGQSSPATATEPPVISGTNPAECSWPRDSSLAVLWQRAREHYHDLPALIYRNESYSYQELDEWSTALASGLAATGVRPGSTVALALQRKPEAVAALLGVLKCGAAYLPLDEKLPPLLVRELLDACDARWIITDRRAGERFLAEKGFGDPGGIRLLDIEELKRNAPGSALPELHGGYGEKPAYIMFTSGSTGEPKGVIIPHRGVSRLAFDKTVLSLKPGEVMAQTAPFGFDASTLEIWSTLLNGATLVFIEDALLMEPELLGNYLQEKRISAMWLTAALFNRIADHAPFAFRPLRVVLSGGEAMSISHVKKVMEASPALKVVNGYGPTENTTFTAIHTVRPEDLSGRSVPIGSPVAGTRIYLLDDAMRPCGAGVIGELYAAGEGLAIGYAGRADLDARVFVTHPDNPEERLYRTGDLARFREDGLLEFCGRRDGQIKLRGHRVELPAIEAVLSGCKGVNDSLAMVNGKGEGMELVAFVSSSQPDEMAWRNRIAERLPLYMMPARFITFEHFPLNANGKKDHSALLEMLREEPEDFPLSNNEERLWILQQLTPATARYNVPLSFAIEGALDSAAFSRALLSLEKRHHALRLVIRPGDDTNPEVRHHLLPPGGVLPQTVECRLSVNPEAEADRRMEEEISRPFRLEAETPVRTFLFRVGEEQWRFLMVMHHIACDGWSLNILLDDLARFYDFERGLSSAPPPPAGFSLRDYVAAEKRFLESREERELILRRVQRLTPPPEPLDLPTDRMRPATRSYEGAAVDIRFDAFVSRGLDRLAGESGVTPYVMLLSLSALLLYRLAGYNRREPFALGALSSGREGSEMADLAGFLVNTLVLPCRIEPDQSFLDHLASVNLEWQAALCDQQCAFGRLVDSLNLPRDLSRNPLFDVLVAWQDLLPEPPRLSGLETRSYQARLPFAKFDLAFNFMKRDGTIELFLEYSTELFEEESALRIVQRLEALARSVIARPGEAVSLLDIWIPGEKEVMEGFNNTALSLPTRRSIIEPFLEISATHATECAVIAHDGNMQNYSTFARKAGGVAALLESSGLGRAEAVIMLLPRSEDMLAALFGILMAGGVYVPLDASHPAERLRDMIDEFRNPLVLVDQPLPALLSGRCRAITLPSVAEEANPVSRAEPDDPAYIIFTSGSTGRPKGVLIEHHAVLNRILWMQRTFPIGTGDVILQKTPVTFDVSIWELFWWSWTGAAVAMLRPGAEKDPEELAAAIKMHGVTVIHFVPSMLAAFLDTLENRRIEFSSIASLRLVFSSGEALDRSLAERFNRLVYDRSGAELHNLYGPTEATVDVSWQCASPWRGKSAVSIGRPIANTTLYILDGRHHPLPVGIPGEIAIGGVQVARGYLNRPELTAERFIADPFTPGGRLYLTGDCGLWQPDGSIAYLGRSDWQVKIRGQRIEPGEIEHALETHTDIVRAVVVPVSNQGLDELHAWILCDGSVDLGEVRRFLREQLPESMIPARFILLRELPYTLSGKLDRKQLMQRSQALMSPSSAGCRQESCGDEYTAVQSIFSMDEDGESLKLRLRFNTGMISAKESAEMALSFSSMLQEIAGLQEVLQTGLPSQRDQHP
ncbi:MAG: amino acid adenylation domain-containing protein [Chlorobiaceae bacterium]|nr:amino acid adenylation domain-containing protein [Chlorobiaceae bacterium]